MRGSIAVLFVGVLACSSEEPDPGRRRPNAGPGSVADDITDKLGPHVKHPPIKHPPTKGPGDDVVRPPFRAVEGFPFPERCQAPEGSKARNPFGARRFGNDPSTELHGGCPADERAAIGFQVIGEHPHELACTATVIDEERRVILTAAHCFVPHGADPASLPEEESGNLGTFVVFAYNGATNRTPLKIVRVHRYGHRLDDHDVAIALLEKSTPATVVALPGESQGRPNLDVGHIPLASAFPARGTLVRQYGCGCTKRNATCEEQAADFTRQFIDYHLGEQFVTCPGDSGGPVIVNSEIFGVASARRDCGEVVRPDSLGNVAALREQINDKITEWLH